MSDQSGYSIEELKKLLQSQPENTVVTVEFPQEEVTEDES